MSSPYTPPGAPVRDPRGVQKGSPLKAVILGVLTDLGGSFAASVVLTTIFAMNMAAGGATDRDIATALSQAPKTSWVYLTGLVLGGFCSLAGGYVCARIAKQSEYALGAIVGAVSVAFGVYFAARQHSLVANLGLAAVTFVLVMIGVRLGVARNARSVKEDVS